MTFISPAHSDRLLIMQPEFSKNVVFKSGARVDHSNLGCFAVSNALVNGEPIRGRHLGSTVDEYDDLTLLSRCGELSYRQNSCRQSVSSSGSGSSHDSGPSSGARSGFRQVEKRPSSTSAGDLDSSPSLGRLMNIGGAKADTKFGQHLQNNCTFSEHCRKSASVREDTACKGNDHYTNQDTDKKLAALTEQLCVGMNLVMGSGGKPASVGNLHYKVSASRDDVQSGIDELINVEKEACRICKPLAVCFCCKKAIDDDRDACHAIGRTYHVGCFVCTACGRTLRGKAFYFLHDQAYCEEDYKYTGFQQMAEHCTACGQLIIDEVLQAVGRPYHPGCFRCQVCSKCLDGTPFTLDSEGGALCLDDYHKLYAPRCAACGHVILPLQGSEETVRVVALGKDYHIDCYHCRVCGMQLTDEPDQRCYPVGDTLLCRECHLARRRSPDAIHGTHALA